MLGEYLRIASIVAWAACLACLSPAVWRALRRRRRSLDAIWLTVFLLACNRLAYLLHVPIWLAHASAAALAMVMAVLTVSYQHSDEGTEIDHGRA